MFLTPHEKLLLDICVRYYRTLAADCDDPKCFVFPNRPNKLTPGCCGQIRFSGMAKIISKAARKCHSENKITSRILRRSQITALWRDDPSQAWRIQVVEQCGHSLETASRYYEFSEKVHGTREAMEPWDPMAVSERSSQPLSRRRLRSLEL